MDLSDADLINSGAADYIQMDVCCQGGFAMGRRIFAAVADKGLRFAFHSWGTALEVISAAHLGICWPAIVAEWLATGSPAAPIGQQPECRREVAAVARQPVLHPWRARRVRHRSNDGRPRVSAPTA